MLKEELCEALEEHYVAVLFILYTVQININYF